MKKVTLILKSWSVSDRVCLVGGSAKSPYLLANQLKNVARINSVIAFDGEADLNDSTIRIYKVNFLKLFFNTFAQNIYSLVAVWKAFISSDVIQCHHPHYGLVAALLKRTLYKQVAFIVKAHGTALPELRSNDYKGAFGLVLRLNAYIHHYTDKFVLSSADYVLCSSNYQQREMVKIYDVKLEKLKTFYNGFSVNSYVDVARGYSGPKLKIFFVGRLVPKKNPSYVVTMANALSSMGYDCEVEMVLGRRSEIEHVPTYMKLLKDVEMSNCKINMHFDVDEIALYELMKSCDVGLIPSKNYESIPSSLYEMVACGLRVFATYDWGIKEVIKPSNSLEHSPLVDADRIVKSLSQNDTGFNGVIRDFSYSCLISKYVSLYEVVCEKNCTH